MEGFRFINDGCNGTLAFREFSRVEPCKYLLIAIRSECLVLTTSILMGLLLIYDTRIHCSKQVFMRGREMRFCDTAFANFFDSVGEELRTPHYFLGSGQLLRARQQLCLSEAYLA
jgi:hypothetical protein